LKRDAADAATDYRMPGRSGRRWRCGGSASPRGLSNVQSSAEGRARQSEAKKRVGRTRACTTWRGDRLRPAGPCSRPPGAFGIAVGPTPEYSGCAW